MKSISYLVDIDQHKDTSRVAVFDGRGQIVDQFEVHHDAVRVLDEDITRLPGGVAVAREATGFYDLDG